MSEGQSFKDSVGGLWLKTSQNGNKFMSGEIKIDGVSYPIVMFKNDKGDNERRPDYRIYPSKPREGHPDPWKLEEPAQAGGTAGGEDDGVPF